RPPTTLVNKSSRPNRNGRARRNKGCRGGTLADDDRSGRRVCRKQCSDHGTASGGHHRGLLVAEAARRKRRRGQAGASEAGGADPEVDPPRLSHLSRGREEAEDAEA